MYAIKNFRLSQSIPTYIIPSAVTYDNNLFNSYIHISFFKNEITILYKNNKYNQIYNNHKGKMTAVRRFFIYEKN